MTKKYAKKALVSSVLALILCFSMLIGTTFAWFTDSVTSGKNQIVSGNLDIELDYFADPNGNKNMADEDAWADVEGTTDLFAKETLWEPGHTEVVYLRITNKGNLALKYQFSMNFTETEGINVNGETFKLSEHLKYDIVEVSAPYATRDAARTAVGATAKNLATYSVTGSMTTQNESKTVALVIYMPEEVDNVANYKTGTEAPVIDLGISVVATQMTNESDSFGSDYDEDAMTFVNSATEAQAALDNAVPGMILKLAPGVNYGTLYLRPTENNPATKTVDWIGNNYGYESYSLFENLIIVGAEGATVDAIVIEGGTYYHTEHSQADDYPVMLSLVELRNVIIDGVTFTGNGGRDPQGYGNAINLSGNNIKVNGLTVKNCVLKNSSNDARLIYKTEATTTVHNYVYEGSEYTFSPTLKNITVTNCTFNGGYMGLELRETENLTITNNTFNVADRNILLPVNTGCTYSGTITITGNVSNNAKERFVRADGTGDAVVVIKNNTLNNYMGADADYIKVTNGNNVTIENNTLANTVSDGLMQDTAGIYYVSNAEGLATLNTMMANKTAGKNVKVELTADIDFNGKTWTPVDSHADTAFTFSGLDGNGHTISNLTVNGQAMFTRFAGTGDVVIRDVTFDGATITSTNLNTSILTVQTYQNVLLDNVDVKNSSITGAYKVAPLIATVYNESSSTITATLKNCDVSNTTVKATSFDFCTTGMVAFVYAEDNDKIEFENCTVTNVSLSAVSGGYSAHAAIYTTGSESLFNEAEGVTVTNCTFEVIQ